MAVIAFAGPSLGRAQDVPGVVFRPPARCGDVTRAVAERPRAIALIDGVFETVPAVWHKEIVHALAEGVGVYGGASIGALRAVELAPFGMVGVGRVFAAFRDGVLEDDDEVAVLHGPAELGYPAVTEAMVNIRATLAACGADPALTAAAKALFYKERTWERVLAGVDAAAAADILARRVDLKREDAHSVLAAAVAHVPRGRGVPVARTTYWVRHLARYS